MGRGRRTDGRRRFLHLAAGAAAMPAVPRFAWAQAYPSRPVRMIVPFGPGGPTDAAARLLAQKLSEHFGQQFYVENVPGASANIGTGQAARAAPDGHTILVTVNNYVINPSLFKTIPYDPYKDFEPVSLAVTFASALTVHPSVPATTVKISSRSFAPTRANTTLLRRDLGRRRISWANNSAFRSVSTSCTCRSTAVGRRWPPLSEAIRRFPLAPWRRLSRRSRTAGCGRSQS